MYTVLYSWLAAAAVAPFVVILSCWTLAVFRTYRPDWRLLDIFLYALVCLEVASALFSFGYAVLGAIRPALEAPCLFIVWGLTATRVFHLSAVTSLLLDRAIASKWPSSYRSSVRQSQVRYHVIVLAVISVFVGVTSVFARLPAQAACSLHPLRWDARFSAFLCCLFAALIAAGLVCCLCVQAGRFQGSYRTTTPHEPRGDLEWAVVASVCWLSYLLNHGPYLVLNVLGLLVPTFWSPWLDNSVVWLRLVQGLLVPCVLLAADMPHRCALRNMLRQSGRIYRHLSDHGGFRIQVGEAGKPGFPPYPPYHVAPFPPRLRWTPTHLPSLQSLQPLDTQSLGYTTLLSLSSTYSSPFSSCSGHSLSSVTTNAVDDFVFRRPSVLALFNPSEEKRCDTPAPFLVDYPSDKNHSHSREDSAYLKKDHAHFREDTAYLKKDHTHFREDTAYLKKDHTHFREDTAYLKKDHTHFREDTAYLKKDHTHFREDTDYLKKDHAHFREDTAYLKKDHTHFREDTAPSKKDHSHFRDVTALSKEGPSHFREGSTPFKTDHSYFREDAAPFRKGLSAFKGDVAPFKKDHASRNMVNIILQSNMDDSFDDSSSSDVDSVQSIIICQRVDQTGRVVASDISQKVVKGDSEEVITEQKILYSEYL